MIEVVSALIFDRHGKRALALKLGAVAVSARLVLFGNYP